MCVHFPIRPMLLERPETYKQASHTGLLLACEVQSFRITGRAQFPIGTVPGYMYMKYRYTEFQYTQNSESMNEIIGD